MKTQTVKKVNVSVIKRLRNMGYYVISFKEAERIKKKYFDAGMQEYFNRYMEGGQQA